MPETWHTVINFKKHKIMAKDKNKSKLGTLLKRVWIVCLIIGLFYFIFAGQDFSVWVEILLAVIAVGSFIYGVKLNRRKRAKHK